MSLDGFIATKEDDISWLSIVEKEGEDYGYTAFGETIDTYIVGRKTYDTVLQLMGGVFPQAQQYQCYVITRQTRSSEHGVIFYNEDLGSLIRQLKQENGKHIYCDGGGQIVQLLMKENLIDEYIISVIPIMLGNGKRLFLGDTPTISLKALSVQQFETGLMQLRYVRKTD